MHYFRQYNWKNNQKIKRKHHSIGMSITQKKNRIIK